MPQYILAKSDKLSIRWLVAKHHGIRSEYGDVPYSMAKQLIRKAVVGAIDDEEDDASHIVYVKRLQKCNWLEDFLDENTRAVVIIETLDIEYEDVKSLNKLNVVNTLRCDKHAKHCAMQNVFKIFNWWSKHQREMHK